MYWLEEYTCIVLLVVPVTEWSLTAALHSSILAECQGTYRSCVEPASRTCLNICKLDFCDNWYIKVCRISVASFKASWCKLPDFFHFCMNHMPMLTRPELLYSVPRWGPDNERKVWKKGTRWAIRLRQMAERMRMVPKLWPTKERRVGGWL